MNFSCRLFIFSVSASGLLTTTSGLADKLLLPLPAVSGLLESPILHELASLYDPFAAPELPAPCGIPDNLRLRYHQQHCRSGLKHKGYPQPVLRSREQKPERHFL